MHLTNGNTSDLTPAEQQLLVRIRRRKAELLSEIKVLKDEITLVTSEMAKLESQDEAKAITRQRHLSIGKKRFNIDPKKGIEYLVENDLLKHTPEEIASFLAKSDGLNKTAIGEYLGEKSDFNLAVLDAFVQQHDFNNLLIVKALRQFLSSFRLPGEAQKIDRMMEKFAARYCQQNPNVFSSTDTCYILSYAIIMLNTALHNPNVKEKPTLENFISMNRGINDGKDLSRELLASLYDSIKQEPFKITDNDTNDLMRTVLNPDQEGKLLTIYIITHTFFLNFSFDRAIKTPFFCQHKIR